MDGDLGALEGDNYDNSFKGEATEPVNQTGASMDVKKLEPESVVAALHTNTILYNIISGPHTLGYSLKKLDFSSVSLLLLGGSAINIFLSGAVLNYLVKKPIVDTFGSSISGFSQIMSGIIYEPVGKQ
jgi:hypothetical protein